MQRIKDPLSYFFSKSKLELEGKILRIDKEKEIKKLKDLNAIIVFQGVVTSEYWYGHPKNIFVTNFLQEAIRINNYKDHWVRLRIMHDLNGKKIYSAETKFKWEENTRIEIGSIIEEKRWIELRENYEKTSFLKEREIKSREIYILPGKNGEEYRSGIEYNLDHIFNPVILPGYLEIEADCIESFIEALDIMEINDLQVKFISCKKLIYPDSNSDS